MSQLTDVTKDPNNTLYGDTVDDLYESMDELIDKLCLAIEQRDSAKDKITENKMQNLISFIRILCAKEFARENGWVWSDTSFGKYALLNQVYQHDDDIGNDRNLPYLDHPYPYRDQNGIPVAMIGHIYNIDQIWDSLVEECEQQGILATRPGFLSWWKPAETTLVMYRPLQNLT